MHVCKQMCPTSGSRVSTLIAGGAQEWVHLELWQVGILCRHFIREPLDHGLLDLPHKAQRLLLLDGDLLLVLRVQQSCELVQRFVQGRNRPQTRFLRSKMSQEFVRATMAS